MKLNRFFFAALLCVFLAGVVPLQAQQGGSVSVAPPTAQSTVSASLDQMGVRQYLLGPGDIVEVRVFEEPRFDNVREVNSDGNLELPFIGSIPAQCRSVQAIKADVATALSRFLRNPQVDVLLRERRSRPPAVVSGAVRMPQQFQIYRQVRLLELLAYTGGVTEAANGTIEVFHTSPEICPQSSEIGPTTQSARTNAAPSAPSSQQPEETVDDPLRIPFDVYSLNDLRLGRSQGNPFIRPGDAIFVRESSPVYITGAVIQPQGIYLRDRLTLTRALAQVGGTRRDARTNLIRVYRQRPGVPEPEILSANLDAIRRGREPDLELQAYDIIEVGEASILSRNRLRDMFLGLATGGIGQVATGLPLRVLY